MNEMIRPVPDDPSADLEREKQPESRFTAQNQARLDAAREYLENPESFEEGETLERLKGLHAAEIALSTAGLALLIAEEYREVNYLLRSFEIRNHSGGVKSLLVEGDSEGEQLLRDAAERAGERRNAFFNECRKLAEDRELDDEKISKQLLVLREKQEELVKEYAEAEPPEILGSFDDEQRERIAKNVFSVELTKGCSVRCNFCAFDAARGVRDAFSFKDAAWFASNGNGKEFYYWASDPLDYVASDDPEKSYADVESVFEATHGYAKGVSTAYPRRSGDRLHELGDRVNRFSVSGMNAYRLVKDGLFTKTEKGSLIPQDVGIENILFGNRFSSARRTFERGNPILEKEPEDPHERYRFQRDREIFRATPAYYFAEGSFGGVYNFQEGFVDSEAFTPKDAGRNREEGSETVGSTIACRDGVLVTIDGVHNSVRTFATEERKNGYAVAPITAENLAAGAERIQALKEDFDGEMPMSIEDVLPVGVVREAHGSIISVYDPSYLETRIAAAKKGVSEAEMKVRTGWPSTARALEEKQKTLQNIDTNAITIDVQNGDDLEEWHCRYHLITGRILELEKSV